MAWSNSARASRRSTIGRLISGSGESLRLDLLPRHHVARGRVIGTKASIEFRPLLLGERRLETLIDHPIPELVHEPQAILDRPGIRFREDGLQIHGTL